MTGIIDYGSGNLRSVYNAFRYIGEDVKVCAAPEDLKGADRIVLPGVGSSADAMEGLRNAGLLEPMLAGIKAGTSFLGICLGLQMLFERSEESGGCECLAIVRGDVRRFPAGEGLKIPQIGWNTVKFTGKACPLFDGIKDESYFYFVHSYYCDNAEQSLDSGRTEYGVSYTSAMWKDNVHAVQFHPERSQANGIKILENFVKL